VKGVEGRERKAGPGEKTKEKKAGSGVSRTTREPILPYRAATKDKRDIVSLKRSKESAKKKKKKGPGPLGGRYRGKVMPDCVENAKREREQEITRGKKEEAGKKGLRGRRRFNKNSQRRHVERLVGGSLIMKKRGAGKD